MSGVFTDPDAAMTRVSAARDIILQQSNRFLISGMVFAGLYCIKAVGLRLDVVVLDTKVFDVPYGLFVFCLLGAASFLIAQTRFMDAHALDCRLRSYAKIINADQFGTIYRSFPSHTSWLDLTREEFFSGESKAPWGSSWAFVSVGLLMLLIYFSPVIASIHYLWNWPGLAGEQMANFQWWAVLTGVVADVLFFSFLQKVYSLRRT